MKFKKSQSYLLALMGMFTSHSLTVITEMVPHRLSIIQNAHIQPDRKILEPYIYLKSLY